MKDKPNVYLSIPSYINEELYKIYIQFLTSIGYTCTIWDRSEKYNRNIMNNSDIHLVLYDFNQTQAGKMGFLPKGSTQESRYAQITLNIPSYLMYLPISNKKGLGFFKFEIDDWADENDWVNYSEIQFKGRKGIINTTYELLKKYDIYNDNLIHKINLAYLDFINRINKFDFKRLKHYKYLTIDSELLDKWVENNSEFIHINLK